MAFDKFLNHFIIDNKTKIVYGLNNGVYIFATLVDKIYLRNIKEIKAYNGLSALKEYLYFIISVGYTPIFKHKDIIMVFSDKYSVDNNYKLIINKYYEEM